MMNVMGAIDVVKVRVCNNTKTSLNVLLYQSDVEVDAISYLTGAWRNTMLASGAVMTAKMPIDMSVGASTEGNELEVSTKLLPAAQGDSFEIFTDNVGALDIKDIQIKKPSGVITLTNTCDNAKWVKVYKDGAPILAAQLRPDFDQSIAIKPQLGFAIGTNAITTAFFDTAQLSKKTVADLRNQSFVTFTLTENLGTKKITIEISYDSF